MARFNAQDWEREKDAVRQIAEALPVRMSLVTPLLDVLRAISALRPRAPSGAPALLDYVVGEARAAVEAYEEAITPEGFAPDC